MKPGRNDPCHCGSGQKYKKCCLAKDDAARAASLAAQVERPAEPAAEGAVEAAGRGPAPHARAPAPGAQPRPKRIPPPPSPVRRKAV